MVRLVGLAAAVVSFVSSCAYATTVQVSQDGQFNITSPLDNSIYVAGQILPITYRLGDATLSSFGLNVYLKSSTVANFSEVAIATGADVSKSSVQTDDGATFYQHTINYAIPSVNAAGSYQVVFESTNTNVNTTIPITMNAAAASSSSVSASATGASGSSSASSTGGSIFNNAAPALSYSAIPVALAAAGAAILNL